MQVKLETSRYMAGFVRNLSGTIASLLAILIMSPAVLKLSSWTATAIVAIYPGVLLVLALRNLLKHRSVVRVLDEAGEPGKLTGRQEKMLAKLCRESVKRQLNLKETRMIDSVLDGIRTDFLRRAALEAGEGRTIDVDAIVRGCIVHAASGGKA